MRPKIFLISLVLLTFAAGGCTSPAAGKEVARARFEKFFIVRDEADSWEQLVAQTHPTLTWTSNDPEDGRFLLWVKYAWEGPPLFTLARAYPFELPGRPSRWFIVERRDLEYEDWQKMWDERDQFADDYIDDYDSAMWYWQFKPADHLPEQADPGDYEGGGYAIQRAADPEKGAVYEIAWQESSGGTAHPVTTHLLYVLQTPFGGWQFLGEGPSEVEESGYAVQVHAQVKWPDAPDPDSPPEIHFVVESSYDPIQGDGSDSEPDDNLTVWDEAVLAGKSPAVLRYANSPYTVAKAGDTFDSLLRRLKNCAEEGADPAKTWPAALAQLDPLLPHGPIPEGTRIRIVTYAQMMGSAPWPTSATAPAAP